MSFSLQNDGRRTRALCFALCFLTLTCVFAICVFGHSSSRDLRPKADFSGDGTAASPYLINSRDDLIALRDAVNTGVSYEGVHFLQTVDIDLDYEPWVPIGRDEETPFGGIFDGSGHVINGLFVVAQELKSICDDRSEDYIDQLITYATSQQFAKSQENLGGDSGKSGLFGYLSGAVINLGIESGHVFGRHCGSIAAESLGSHASIQNCYSLANVYGLRAGGIAGYFPAGDLICCFYDGDVKGLESDGLIGTNCDAKLYHCYSSSRLAPPGGIDTKTSRVVPHDYFSSSDFASKLNLSAALANVLYSSNRDSARLYEWTSGDNHPIYCSEQFVSIFLCVLNDYFLPIALLLALILYYRIRWIPSKGRVWEQCGREIQAFAIIFLILSAFVDCAVASKGVSVLNPGNIIFVVLVNSVFFLMLGAFVCYAPSVRIDIKKHRSLLIVIAIATVIGFTQFDVVPKYDAGIYYGSFAKGCELFQVDLFTYIGDFVCWKWIHGLALLIAPLEFVFPGQAFGVYLSNYAINAAAIAAFYSILRKSIPLISNATAAVLAFVFIASPYQLGLVSYLCMDGHTALFIAFLVWSYLKRNDVLISFVGYLLCFNKITGLVFYGIFLVTVAIYEVVAFRDSDGFIRALLRWWSWKRFFLWVFPVALFAVAALVGEDLTVMGFYGSYTEASIGLKSLRGLANTLLQSGVYGLRWIMVLISLVFLLALAFKKDSRAILSKQGMMVLICSVIASVVVVASLCIYKGDAECPRYTAPLNFAIALCFACAVFYLFRTNIKRMVAAMAMSLLLAVQCFWTIDPVLTAFSSSIDSGKKEIYKLALPGDKRASMVLGKNYGKGIESLSDLFTYNFEHDYYDSLLDDAFTYYEPDDDTYFLVLDVIDYELHIDGNRYPIYWDRGMKHRTYNNSGENILSFGGVQSVTTEQLKKGRSLPNRFILFVPARVSSDEAEEAINNLGFCQMSSAEFDNVYGSLSVFEYCKSIGSC